MFSKNYQDVQKEVFEINSFFLVFLPFLCWRQTNTKEEKTKKNKIRKKMPRNFVFWAWVEKADFAKGSFSHLDRHKLGPCFNVWLKPELRPEKEACCEA